MKEQTLKPELQAQEAAKKASYFEQEYNILRMKYEVEQDKNTALKDALRENVEIAKIALRYNLCYESLEICELCVEQNCRELIFIKKYEELLK